MGLQMSSNTITNVATNMKVGHGTFVMGMSINNPNGVPVIAGKYCSIALFMQILGYDHAIISVPNAITQFPFDAWWQMPSFPNQVNSGGYKGKSQITIGNDVWTGQSVCLRPGITIGDGAIIGSCSVVMKDVPPYAIVGGNPVKIIRYRYTPEQIERLLEIKWWDWSEDKIKKNYHLFDDITKFLNTPYID